MTEFSTPVLRQRVYGRSPAHLIVSRALSMIKSQLKQVLLMLLIPLVFMFLYGLLINLPALTTGGKNPAVAAVLTLIGVLGGLGFAILGGISTSLVSLILARQFYSSLIYETPLSIKENLAFFKNLKVIVFVIVHTVIVGVLYSIFLILDFIILWFGIIAAGGTLGFLSELLKKSAIASLQGMDVLMTAGGIIYMLVIGFVVVALLLMLIGIQLMLLLSPYVTMITSDGKDFFTPYKEAYFLVFRNFSKMLPYSMMLIIFNALLFYSILLPVFGIGVPLIIMWQKMDPNAMVSTGVAYHLKVIGNLLSSLTGVITAPLILASVTLFIYDCRVKTDAFDLQLWLARMAQNTDNKVTNLMTLVKHWLPLDEGKPEQP